MAGLTIGMVAGITLGLGVAFFASSPVVLTCGSAVVSGAILGGSMGIISGEFNMKSLDQLISVNETVLGYRFAINSIFSNIQLDTTVNNASVEQLITICNNVLEIH